MSTIVDHPVVLESEECLPESAGKWRLLRMWPDRPFADPWWARLGIATVLAVSAVLYLWDLSASGWANAYYSAAAQAGSASWKALFFGSFDAASAITVDKTPASLWLMGASVRIFGLNSWSILVPEALCGVATVGVLYLAVRRVAGPGAGLLAATLTAITPVAVLMFRFNNPDALLVLLLTAAAYCVIRAREHASTGWLVAAGALVGAGFLTKMLQAVLVLPALGIVYLVTAPTRLRRRIWQLLLSSAAMLAAAGWWVAIVQLWPASSRPYIGGSQTNSVIELMVGYNGLGRITGNQTGSVIGGGGQGGPGSWGPTGLLRMFGADVGSQISWLIPAAVILLAAGLWTRRHTARTDAARASLILWGAWFVVTALVFSLMEGIFHAYYTVALAPAVAATVAIPTAMLWMQRRRLAVRLLLAGVVALTAWWSYTLMARSADWHPAVRMGAIVVGAVAAIAVVGVAHRGRLLATAAAGLMVLTLALGPSAYAIDTAATPHTGAIPSAGPAALGSRFGGSRQPPAGVPAFAPGSATLGAFGGPPGLGGLNPGGSSALGRPGGLLDVSTPGDDVVVLLSSRAGDFRWVAATIGANSAAGYQLATELPVMAIGGFNGTDPSPTLAEFIGYVADGEIHYFIAGNGLGRDQSSEIESWVADHYQAMTVDGVTLFDLSSSIES